MTYLDSEERKKALEFWMIHIQLRMIDNDIYHLHTDPPPDQKDYERVIGSLCIKRHELMEQATQLRKDYNIYITDLNRYW